MNMSVQISVCVLAFTSFVHMPESGISRSSGNSMFSFLSNLHSVLFCFVFYWGHAILYSYKQWTRVPIFPQPCQCLFFFFLILAILRDMM